MITHPQSGWFWSICFCSQSPGMLPRAPVLFRGFCTWVILLLLTFPILASSSVKGLKFLMTLGPWKYGGKYSAGGPELAPVFHNVACQLPPPRPPSFFLSQKNYSHAKLPKYLGEGWQTGVICHINSDWLIDDSGLAMSRLSGKRVVDKWCWTCVRSTANICPPSQS